MTQVKNKTVTEYLDQDYAMYGMYTLENRAIPSVIDGFKPTARKIIFIADKVWRTGSEKPTLQQGAVSSSAEFRTWDDLFGILAWKFRPTKSGDMFLDAEKVYEELKDKFELKRK